jgi:hypothetical protein
MANHFSAGSNVRRHFGLLSEGLALGVNGVPVAGHLLVPVVAILPERFEMSFRRICVLILAEILA